VCRYNWHSAGFLGWPSFSMLQYKHIFSNKTCGSNFIKQHSETVMVRNYHNVYCSLNKFIVLFIIIFGTLSFLMGIPWKSRGNGNKSPTWERECEGVEIKRIWKSDRPLFPRGNFPTPFLPWLAWGLRFVHCCAIPP